MEIKISVDYYLQLEPDCVEDYDGDLEDLLDKVRNEWVYYIDEPHDAILADVDIM